MRVVAAVAALLLAGVAEAQTINNVPTCRADRSGEDLTTRIVFPDGYVVEGPWHVTGEVKSGQSMTLTAVLDHIIETRPVSTKKQLVELPGAIEMTFRGRTIDEVLDEAANVWCVTVLKARPTLPAASAEPVSPNRIM